MWLMHWYFNRAVGSCKVLAFICEFLIWAFSAIILDGIGDLGSVGEELWGVNKYGATCCTFWEVFGFSFGGRRFTKRRSRSDFIISLSVEDLNNAGLVTRRIASGSDKYRVEVICLCAE